MGSCRAVSPIRRIVREVVQLRAEVQHRRSQPHVGVGFRMAEADEVVNRRVGILRSVEIPADCLAEVDRGVADLLSGNILAVGCKGLDQASAVGAGLGGDAEGGSAKRANHK